MHGLPRTPGLLFWMPYYHCPQTHPMNGDFERVNGDAAHSTGCVSWIPDMWRLRIDDTVQLNLWRLVH
jgi:hypothetical protein